MTDLSFPAKTSLVQVRVKEDIPWLALVHASCPMAVCRNPFFPARSALAHPLTSNDGSIRFLCSASFGSEVACCDCLTTKAHFFSPVSMMKRIRAFSPFFIVGRAVFYTSGSNLQSICGWRQEHAVRRFGSRANGAFEAIRASGCSRGGRPYMQNWGGFPFLQSVDAGGRPGLLQSCKRGDSPICMYGRPQGG